MPKNKYFGGNQTKKVSGNSNQKENVKSIIQKRKKSKWSLFHMKIKMIIN
jgi:hypothetical protein